MFQLNKFFYPEEGVSTPIEEGALTKDGILDKLNEVDDEESEPLDLKEPKKETKEKGEEDKEGEEKDELDLIEEELNEEKPDEEDLELIVPARRQEILKAFPDIFKKFPSVEKSIYRDQQYTEVFPTIKEAKEALNSANVLNQFEADLGKGDISKALGAIKATNEDAFNNLVDNYLPYLAKLDEKAYGHIVNNVMRTALTMMDNDGIENKDDDLRAAAAILNKFLFRSEKITGPTALAKPKREDNPKEEIERERQKFMMEKFESVRDDLNTKVGNRLKATISINIDPKESMTEYVKNVAIKDCEDRLETAISGDKRITSILDRLWVAAKNDNFSKVSIDKIQSAYLSAARSLLPGVINQARREALKGMGKRVRDDEDDTPKKGLVPTGRTASNKTTERSSGKPERSRDKVLPRGMSTEDYLNSD